MPLTCVCWGGEESAWWYFGPADYTRLAAPRARRCCSCKERIPRGALCVEFERRGRTQGWVQERIFGDEMPLPSWWMCERCGDLYFSLDELGFCVQLGGESMMELVREYGEIYGARTVLRRKAQRVEEPAQVAPSKE